jgi:hypothetical protein
LALEKTAEEAVAVAMVAGWSEGLALARLV